MKKTFYYIFILFVLNSCNNEEDENPHPNLGNYKLNSLTSNVAIDLNYDDIATKDFKEELSIYFLGPSKPRNALELVASYEKSRWFFYLGIPKDSDYPDRIDDIALNLRYGVGDYSKNIVLNNGKPKIMHFFNNNIKGDSTWLVNNKYPYPYKMVLNNDNKVTINVAQKFYDLFKEEWIFVDLVGVFEKK